MVDFPAIPSRMALLNIDMQGFIVDITAGGSDLLDRINRLIRVCREKNILIVHTAHVIRADGSNAGVMAEIAPIVREGLLNEGSEAVKLHKDLDIRDDDILLKQTQVRRLLWNRP